MLYPETYAAILKRVIEEVITEGKVLTPLFRITVAWEVGNGKHAVKVYEAKSPQQAWQAAVLETTGLPMDLQSSATGSAGMMGFPMQMGSGSGEGVGEEGDGEDGMGGVGESLGSGRGQESHLVGSEHFLDMPGKTATVKPPPATSAAASGTSAGVIAGGDGGAAAAGGLTGTSGVASSGSGTGNGRGSVAAEEEEDVYEEPDEEELTLRLQLVEIRKAYFRALRHEQSMGYQSAVTPRLALEVHQRCFFFVNLDRISPF